jgi:hypothetical protein
VLYPVQPAWASSLGVSIDETAPDEEPLPDWLTAIQESPGAAGSETTKESQSGTEIPDWMREAGWEPAPGETHEILPGFEASEEERVGAGEEAGMEIPDWLQDLTAEKEPSLESPLAEQPSDVSDEAIGVAVLATGLTNSQPGPDAQASGEEIPREVETPPLVEEGETDEAGV